MSKVVIAGAGPVGLTAAYMLARAGIEVIVLEREARLAEDLRASTWHPPTLDMMEDLGLVEDILRDGLVARTFQHRDRRTGAIAEFDLSLLGAETQHPYRVQYEQFRYTRLVYERLQPLGNVAVRFNVPVTAVEQDGAGVVVNGSERGDYLIGADGAGSAVRRAIGVPFDGMTFPERFFVLSTPFDFARHFERLSYVNYIADTKEWCVLLKVPGLWRCLFPTEDESDEQILASAEARLQSVFRKPSPYETVHRSIYRVHQRVAGAYRVGRVFLAGDAAHINNPLGGMGMNGGLHDAWVLCRKLVRGDDLDRYEAERRPVAIDYINANTARNRKLMAERDPSARRRAQDEMCRIAADPAAARAFMLKSSMIETLRRTA